MIRKKRNLETSLSVREEKWHEELGVDLSPPFWNNTYRRTAEIKNDNRLKWLQYQIHRNSFYTNYRVNKYDGLVSPYCTFCLQQDASNTNLETVSHLFKDCVIVNGLWVAIGNWLNSLNIQFVYDIRSILFGCHEQPVTSIQNYIILTAKYFVWISKHRNCNLNLIAYQNFLRLKLEDLKNVYIYEKKESNFNQWIDIYDSVSV